MMTKLSLKTLVALLLLPTLLSATGLAGCCHGAAQDAQVGTPVELTPRVLKRTFEAPHVDTTHHAGRQTRRTGLAGEPPAIKFLRYWSNEEPKTPGVMRVLWDSKYLYLGGEFREDLLYADLTEHDSHTWKNDAWEVFPPSVRRRNNLLRGARHAGEHHA